MADITLSVVTAEYVSDTGFQVRAHRTIADSVFTSGSGAPVTYGCIFDTGAPFCVIPFSVWNAHGVPYTSRGTALLKQRVPNAPPEPLLWQGVACELGEAEIFLIDQQKKVQAGPFLLIAKFVLSLLPQHESIALLGMNFIEDNSLRLSVDASGAVPLSVLVTP